MTSIRFLPVTICVMLLVLPQENRAARILAVVPMPSYSHQLAFRPLWKELSLRGHQVVLMTTDVINDPSLTNLTEINMHGTYNIMAKADFADMFTMSEKFSPFTLMRMMMQFGKEMLEYQFGLQEVQDLIKGGKFDLVIGEYLFPAPLAFAERFDCPFIAVTSMDAYSKLHGLMGNPTHPFVYPTQDLAISVPSTFKERLIHSIYQLIFNNFVEDSYRVVHEGLRKYFGGNIPPFEEMVHRIKLTFINAHPAFYQTRPLAPATVNVAGLHISEAKTLPQDLQNFLDSATQGAIYVSFGTNVHKKQLSETHMIETLLEVFEELPFQVVWKVNGTDIHYDTNKIMVRTWFPQRDVLAHKNVKLFITQGGLQSIQESLHCRVPMIGIPFLGDQFNNVLRAQDKGICLVIKRHDLTKGALKNAVLEIIENPRYSKRIRDLADLIEDAPMSPLETAVWWSEYILRHGDKDVSHLKGAEFDATLNEYYMIDVILFLLLILLVALYIVVFLVVSVARKITGKIHVKVVNNTKKVKAS